MSAAGTHDRLIGSLVMIGVVAELDAAQALVRVDVDGMVSGWLPWLTHRAGPGVRVWNAPEVGEQVLVASPYGDPAQGVVVGSIFQEDFDQPADRETLHRTTYADGSVVEYDRESTTLTVTVGSGSVVINCGTATVNATESVTLNTPTTHATGDLNVDGAITAGADITTPTEVWAGNIGLKAHKHQAQGATAITTPSRP